MSSDAPTNKPTPDERMRDTAGATAALHRGVQRALWLHKIMGVPVCTWRDGRVVWIAPDDIKVERPDDIPAPP